MVQTTDRSVIPSSQTVQHITTKEDWLMRGVLILGTLWLLVAVVLPLFPILSRSFFDGADNWIGLGNYIKYFTTPSLATFLIAFMWRSSVP